jgi:hypothetical protein
MEIARHGAVHEDRSLIRRFFGETVREEFIDELERMKDLNMVFLGQVSSDCDPASWAPRHDDGSGSVPDIL